MAPKTLIPPALTIIAPAPTPPAVLLLKVNEAVIALFCNRPALLNTVLVPI